MTEKRSMTVFSKKRSMTALSEEMFEAIIRLGGPCDHHDNRKSWLATAARRAGISVRSAKTLFYRERDYPHSKIVETVRNAVSLFAREQEAEARDEYQTVVDRLSRLEAYLAAIDPDFHRATLDALGDAPHRHRGPADRTRT